MGWWVFKINYGLNGEICKYKTYWVIHGYKQKYNINYNEIWARVVKATLFRSLFSIRVSRNWHIKQIDVVTAFLYELLNKNIDIKQPHSFIQGVLVCRLKMLYMILNSLQRFGILSSEISLKKKFYNYQFWLKCIHLDW